MPSRPVHVVWFKRDLRVDDHAPLAEAAARGPVLPLHVVEPNLWAQPDAAGRHWASIAEGLAELRAALAELGQPLVIRVGRATDIFEDLRCRVGIAGLWSHQETGNGWTFARDREVAAWCRAHGVPWHEPRQHGVLRRLRSRDGWARRWDAFMAQPTIPHPAGLPPLAGLDLGPLPDGHALGLAADPCPGRAAGGRRAGLALLDSFLEERGRPYGRAMSSPVSAVDACSRLSDHIAYGTVSLREIVHAVRRRRAALFASAPSGDRREWLASLDSFVARLHWHCHFVQKLEHAPAIEFAPFHPAFAGLRDDDDVRFEAWASGRTGYPMIDACMRALAATGWINFRMRAMLMAFASYQLWLPWRRTGSHLARLFTDYEPGIHWPQVQMQSGTTGINMLRIYNPTKQGRDHDPDGRFVRQWLPELADAPTAFVHEPWRWPGAAVLEGRYPRPIVDHAESVRLARVRIAEARRRPGFRDEADAIQERHGSRGSGMRRRGVRPPTRRNAAAQLPLDLTE
jgi:deoxyribodipyrimidine photo-lyase